MTSERSQNAYYQTIVSSPRTSFVLVSILAPTNNGELTTIMSSEVSGLISF